MSYIEIIRYFKIILKYKKAIFNEINILYI